MRLGIDYGEVNKKTHNHSQSSPLMENTLETTNQYHFNSRMDKRNGFWLVNLTRAAKELLAFVTPEGRVFRWHLMPSVLSMRCTLSGVDEQKPIYPEQLHRNLFPPGLKWRHTSTT